MTTFTTDDRLHAEKDGSFTIDCRQRPLTNEQIEEIYKESFGAYNTPWNFARAIEKAHGIG